MATTSETLEIETRQLKLLDELGRCAENLAERSKSGDLSASDRAALRNHAKLANEHAGLLLARGAVDLFNKPPGDAAKKIDEAIAGTHKALAKIEEIKKAIQLVAEIVGVAAAVLAGDWKAVFQALSKLPK